ncbi:DinB family protein [Micromonospora sp. NPDC047620]|uniref:DinB family protein n=1 Tax=Micromonospora sp. NPDC047620 TaxID=3364251 RepID=UPI0037126A7A
MKADLHSYLEGGRDALLWKLDGLSEYDIRRPLTRTATNLLGLVKHSAAMEILYFGVVFGRPFEQELPYVGDGAETNADMWATADETREEIVGLYRRAIAHADTTIAALALNEVGRVPWWAMQRSRCTTSWSTSSRKHNGTTCPTCRPAPGGVSAAGPRLPAGGYPQFRAARA